MGMNVQKALAGIESIAIDTAPFIYYIEEHKHYLRAVDQLFTLVDKGSISGCTSIITLIEVASKPMEEKNSDLIARYEELLSDSKNFTMYDIDRRIALESARLRAVYSLKTPDAIQIATGLVNGAQAFITNDRPLKKIKGIKVILLDDLM